MAVSSPQDDESIFAKIKSTTRFVSENAKDVKINQDGIDKFLDSLDEAKLNEKSAVVRFPIKFGSMEEEINFMALLDIINFGSGFRKPLHDLADRGAYETMVYGMLSLVLAGSSLNAEFLCKIMPSDVANHFGFPLTVEKEVMPAVTQTVPSDLRPLAELIAKVLNDVGMVLRNRMISTIGEFVMNVINAKPKNAANLIQKLIQAFPAFLDKAKYNGQEVFLLKKVQLLAADLYRRFADEDERFKFEDIDQVTIMTDNVIPCVLRQLNILTLSDSLSAWIDSGKVLKTGPIEVELRASAITACEDILKRARKRWENDESKKSLLKSLSVVQLDYYLWVIGKDPEFRKTERHYTRDTVFY